MPDFICNLFLSHLKQCNSFHTTSTEYRKEHSLFVDLYANGNNRRLYYYYYFGA